MKGDSKPCSSYAVLPCPLPVCSGLTLWCRAGEALRSGPPKVPELRGGIQRRLRCGHQDGARLQRPWHSRQGAGGPLRAFSFGGGSPPESYGAPRSQRRRSFTLYLSYVSRFLVFPHLECLADGSVQTQTPDRTQGRISIQGTLASRVKTTVPARFFPWPILGGIAVEELDGRRRRHRPPPQGRISRPEHRCVPLYGARLRRTAQAEQTPLFFSSCACHAVFSRDCPPAPPHAFCQGQVFPRSVSRTG